MTSSAKPEFSRPVSLKALEQGGTSLHIEADADERARLADRFGLIGLLSLTAEIHLTLDRGGTLIHLEGRLQADMVQACVVTLEPLQTRAEGRIRRLYATAAADPPEDGGESFDVDAEEPPEPLVGGTIDVGEAVAEQLALELDPFPRKPGISFAGYSVGPGENGDKPSDDGGGEEAQTTDGPFAILAKHMRKRE